MSTPIEGLTELVVGTIAELEINLNDGDPKLDNYLENAIEEYKLYQAWLQVAAKVVPAYQGPALPPMPFASDHKIEDIPSALEGILAAAIQANTTTLGTCHLGEAEAAELYTEIRTAEAMIQWLNHARPIMQAHFTELAAQALAASGSIIL